MYGRMTLFWYKYGYYSLSTSAHSLSSYALGSTNISISVHSKFSSSLWLTALYASMHGHRHSPPPSQPSYRLKHHRSRSFFTLSFNSAKFSVQPRSKPPFGKLLCSISFVKIKLMNSSLAASPSILKAVSDSQCFNEPLSIKHSPDINPVLHFTEHVDLKRCLDTWDRFVK